VWTVTSSLRWNKHTVTCLVYHTTNRFTLSGCSESLLRFACTLMHFTIITCDSNLQYHLASGPILWCADYNCLQRRSSQDWLCLFLRRTSPDRIWDTVLQCSVSRVQQSVALETLLIDDGNVFRLSRCYSTGLPFLRKRVCYNCYAVITVTVVR
jgi:hypothetical protein